MTVRVGLIGAGVMGADHAETIARRISGAELVAVSDPDADKAGAVAVRTGARPINGGGEALIVAPEVDAVLIASPDATHAGLVLACLEAGKPVLCEKPLAPTPEECLRVVATEAQFGRRLVQVGFMRRFDPAYVAMKRAQAAGEIGAPLLFHCVHRNAEAPPWFSSDMLITNSAVHEIDIARWLLGEEFAAARVFSPRPARSGGLRDPQFLVLEARSGVLVDIEVFVNAGYGYDIRAELVCQRGTVALTPPVHVHTRRAGAEAFGFAPDWRPRFADAYRKQLQAWVDAVAAGTSVGASAWDGYVATAVAEACVRSLATRQETAIALQQRPGLYG